MRTANSTFEVILSYKAKDLGSAVIKMSPNIRQIIGRHENTLRLGSRACHVRDHLHVLRCGKCSKFGHSTSKCAATNPICSFCAQSHDSKSCSQKSDAYKHKCSNCISDNIPESENQHSAHSKSCPRFASSLRRLISMTDWGDAALPSF